MGYGHPLVSKMVQKDIERELRLQTRTLIEGQGHQTLSQHLGRVLGKFMADKKWALWKDIGLDRCTHTKVGTTDIIDGHNLGILSECGFKTRARTDPIV